jgi:hypothetical protein
MIKLKDILLESTALDIFVPRRIDDRVERLISRYVRNGSKGNLDLRRMNLTKLPSILKNVNVDGNFNCAGNNLTSLENVPENVSGNFNCSNSNKLTSLVGAPSSVGGDFWCAYCKLTSLTGTPKTVGGNFYCGNNPGKFTETQVRAVCDVKGKIFV